MPLFLALSQSAFTLITASPLTGNNSGPNGALEMMDVEGKGTEGSKAESIGPQLSVGQVPTSGASRDSRNNSESHAACMVPT